MRAMKRQIVLSFVLLLATAGLLQAADQFTGTWTLNVAKSKYSPGMPPKAQTTKLETLKDGIREIVDRVNADGSQTHWDFTAKFDGKDYPITGDPDRDMASVKKVDDYTLEVVNKKAGKVTTSMKLVVAKDGKSRTNTVTGKNAAGVAINNILFFDKN
jgi:histidinol dehydrogenase